MTGTCGVEQNLKKNNINWHTGNSICTLNIYIYIYNFKKVNIILKTRYFVQVHTTISSYL